MIYADFPGPGLIDEVIKANRWLLAKKVTNNNDAGSGSLRQAIAEIDRTRVVEMQTNLDGQTINLTSGDIVKDGHMEIIAPDSSTTVRITANQETRIGNP